MTLKNKRITVILFLAMFCITLAGCDMDMSQTEKVEEISTGADTVTTQEIPDYKDSPFIILNDNIPSFSEEDKTIDAFEYYSPLDTEGRCGMTYANVGQELMPTEKRGSIGSVKPVGWHTVKYDHVEGKYLYNRCHLLGYQLTAENANEENLITGTRYLNVEGMLPFENMVADYIRETNNHVLYRVTPIYEGNELIARGVQMEGYSIEDQGEGICFNVFAYNVQPGVVIDYATGESKLEDDAIQSDMLEMKGAIRGNSKSKIYHCPGQRAYEEMADSKYLVLFATEDEAQGAGYRKAKQ